jgi:hypothetical protein
MLRAMFGLEQYISKLPENGLHPSIANQSSIVPINLAVKGIRQLIPAAIKMFNCMAH